jgi:hypothetical protein
MPITASRVHDESISSSDEAHNGQEEFDCPAFRRSKLVMTCYSRSQDADYHPVGTMEFCCTFLFPRHVDISKRIHSLLSLHDDCLVGRQECESWDEDRARAKKQEWSLLTDEVAS